MKYPSIVFIFLVGLLVFMCSLQQYYGQYKIHTDRFCGTIINMDGSTEPISITITGTDEMSFDFRSNPGKLSLHRCN
jgi:hypothetical protein